jgi:hypothetical protein
LETNVLCLSAGNRKNQVGIKDDFVQPKSAQSGCTGQCPVRQADSGELAALEKSSATYDYNSPDCPVCTGLSGEPTVGRVIRARRVAEPTARRGHRTVSGAPTAPRLQRSASPNKKRDPHRTVWCARRQKARIAFFLECSQRLLAALGL